MKKNKLEIRVGQYVCFAICLLLMIVVPITRDHKLIGFNLPVGDSEEKVETLTENPDGTMVINTTDIGKNIIGYGGPTPLEITVKDNRIVKVKTLPNQETPEFFGAIRNSDMLESFEGMTLQEATFPHVDGVSGATYSSRAVINNVKAAAAYAINEKVEETPAQSGHELDFKWCATIVIILMGAVIPLFLKNKNYRYLQLILNVVVLGFWGGTFISYSLMVSYLSNGITQVVLIPAALMLVTAFIYPMFGKVNHYCTWICPYGSIQDLAGKCFKKKLNIPTSLGKYLTVFREVLWFVLMWLLWTGLWFDWMGYEPFAAFFIKDASPAVLGIAGGFLVLSLFVQRPYCRFVCPTGSLFKFSEGRR